MPEPKRCYVNFLGCEKRKLDTQRIIYYFQKNGYRMTAHAKEADVIVFVTCGFYQKYEDWSIAKIQKIYGQKKKDALFIIGGCLTAINAERLKIFPDALHLKTRELDRLDTIIGAKVPMQAIADPNITIFDTKNFKYDSQRMKTPGQQEYEKAKRGFKVRIHWGCLGNCSYCVTRYAENRLESKPIADIITEMKKGLNSRHKSFFLTGGDTGAYGLDMGSSIIELLREIFALPGEYKIHFQDFGIQWVKKYFSDFLSLLLANPERLGCFCFPIQSGSNKILKSMHRPYQIEDITSLLLQLKEKVPSFYLGTHFIVGFPGETEEDFNQTAELVQTVPFDFLNIFPYCDHKLAESFSYPDKVPQEVTLERYNALFDVFEKKFQTAF